MGVQPSHLVSLNDPTRASLRKTSKTLILRRQQTVAVDAADSSEARHAERLVLQSQGRAAPYEVPSAGLQKKQPSER